MPLINSILGVSRKELVSRVLPKINHSHGDVRLTISDFPYFHHTEQPAEKLQDAVFVTLIARELGIFQYDGEPLYRGLRGFQSYDLSVRLDGQTALKIQFRIDRQGDPIELLEALFDAIDGAFTSAGVRFVRMRK